QYPCRKCFASLNVASKSILGRAGFEEELVFSSLLYS
ncbi:MAG: hypothetical protein ACI87E_004455, partial [Mariniblastus sp.]